MTSPSLALATTGGLKCTSCRCFLVMFRRNVAQCQQVFRTSRHSRGVHGAWKERKTSYLMSRTGTRLCKRPFSCKSQVSDATATIALCSSLPFIAPFAQLVADTIFGMISGGSSPLQAPHHLFLGQVLPPFELDLSAAPLYIFASVLTLAVGSATYGLIHVSSSDDDGNGSSTAAQVSESSTEDWVLLGSDTQFYNHVYSRCPSLSVRSLEPFPASIGSGRAAEAKVVQVRNSSRQYQDFSYQRFCIHTADGGSISLDFPAHLDMKGTEELDSALLIVPGTVEGSGAEGIRAFVSKAMQSGYFPVVFNPRGCGSSPVTSPRLFTAADSDDLQLSIEYLQSSRPSALIVAIGFGFGANILTKYLGEEAKSPPLKAAICVANPFDMEHATTLLTQSKENDCKFTQGLVHVLRANQTLFQRYQKNFDLVKGLSATSLREFDAAISMVSHGFASLEDFYAQASSGPNLWRVKTPLLCIQAEYAAASLLTVPSQDFNQNPFLSLLVSSPTQVAKEGSNIEDISICPEFALEWLAAVELALLKGRHPLDGFKNDTTDQIGGKSAVGMEVSRLESHVQHSQSLISSEADESRHRSKDFELNKNVPQPLSTDDLMAGDAGGRSFDVTSKDLRDTLIDMPDTSYQVHNAEAEEDQGAGEIKASARLPPSQGRAGGDSEWGQGHSTPRDESGLLGKAVKENQDEKQLEGEDGSEQNGEGEEERGQVEQAAESIMNVLDVTIPGTLSNEQKKKIIAAVGRGETVVNAFQEAVPEDVRGKMFDAVSGAMQARGISSKLVGFGKNLPPTTIPDDVIKTIKEKVSGVSLRPQNSTKSSSQTSQAGLKVEESVSQEPQDTTSSELSDQKGAKDGQEPMHKPREDVTKPEEDIQSPSVPGTDGSEVETRIGNQDKQSEGSDDTMDARQPATPGSHHKEETENKASTESGGAQTESTEQDKQSSEKDKGDNSGKQRQGQLDQRKDFHEEGMANDSQNNKDDQSSTVSSEVDQGQRHESNISVTPQAKDTARKGGDGGKDDSNPSGRVQEGQSDRDVKQDKEPDFHPEVHDTQSQGDHRLGEMDVKTPDGITQVTEQTQPDKSSQEKSELSNVMPFLPSSVQNPSSLDISSVLQTLTGFDDSTQMAVTNVFGVVESMLDKLEQESQDYGQQKTADSGTQAETGRESKNSGNGLEDRGEADIFRLSGTNSERNGAVSAQRDSVATRAFSGPNLDDEEINKKLQSMVQEVNESVENDGKATRSLPNKLEQDSPSFVNQMVMDALTLELLRRIGQAGVEASGIDLQNELQKVAGAVTEAVQSAALSLTSPKVGPDSQKGGKLGVLPAEAVVTAVYSVLGTTSILKGLVPVGVLAGVVLSALGAGFLIATNDTQHKGGHQGALTDNNLEGEHAKNARHQEDNEKGIVNGTQNSEGSQGSTPPNGALATMGASGIMGVVAGTMGAVRQDVGTLENTEQEDFSAPDVLLGDKKDAETPGIVSDLAEKAISVAAPVVPKKEDGEVDQERIVAFLADLGQRGGVLRLLGKAALLWGGFRGAMSLTDRVLTFLKMSNRPLHQRLLGFLGLSLLLWSPILVPLLPSLLEQWSSQSPGGVASIAAAVGLYGAIIILITIWGRRIRGYEQPLRHYGLRITTLSKLTALGSGLGLGVLLVVFVYTLEFVLGYVQFSWSTYFVSGPTATKLGIVAASLPGALVTTWKLTTLAAQACGVGFAVAVVEELLFRSWLQEEIAVDLGFETALLLSAAAFAIVHWSLPAMPGLFFLSIALAGTKAQRKGDLSFPIGLHAGLVSANYMLTVGGFVQYVVGSPDWFTGAQCANPLAGALGLGVVAGLALLVYPRNRKKP